MKKKSLFSKSIILISFLLFIVNILTAREWHPSFLLANGEENQKAPNLACDNDGYIYCAYENYDGAHCFISINYSQDFGMTWQLWDDIIKGYDIGLPSITYANDYIFVLYHGNNTIEICRMPLSPPPYGQEYFSIPTPTINPPNIVHRARLCSDSEFYEGNAYLMLAYLYGDGNNDELELYYTHSENNAVDWSDYDYRDDVYKSYQTWDVGIDWGNSGIYISYIATGEDENRAKIIRSIDYGNTWEELITFDSFTNDKFGPVVAAKDSNILIVFQYEGYINDNDILGIYSEDYGDTWGMYFIASEDENEELPWVAHDNNNNFCVTYILDDEVYAQIGENSPEVDNPIRIDNNSDAFNDDYTTVIGKTNESNSEGFIAAWVEGDLGDLDIWGNRNPDPDDDETDDWNINEYSFKLYQNYPNPINQETSISFSIPINNFLELSIYNIKGQKINQLVNEFYSKGTHQIIWDGTDMSGKNVKNGIYLYRLETKGYSETKKMILLR